MKATQELADETKRAVHNYLNAVSQAGDKYLSKEILNEIGENGYDTMHKYLKNIIEFKGTKVSKRRA